jgi:hypothetical protein
MAKSARNKLPKVTEVDKLEGLYMRPFMDTNQKIKLTRIALDAGFPDRTSYLKAVIEDIIKSGGYNNKKKP